MVCSSSSSDNKNSMFLKLIEKQNSALGNQYQLHTEMNPHLGNCKQAILDGAKGLNGEALIFGIGQAKDIPLELLAKQFDKLTLVDIDAKTSMASIRKLTPETQRKITFICKDISGYGSQIVDAMEAWTSANPKHTYNEFLFRLVCLLCNHIKDEPRMIIDHKVSFVASQLLMCQLSSLLLMTIGKLAEKYHKETYATHEGYMLFLKWTTPFSAALQIQHIKLLAMSVLHGGRIQLSFTSKHLPKGVIGSVLPITHTLVLTTFETMLKKIKYMEWIWQDTPRPVLDARSFMAEAHTFELL